MKTLFSFCVCLLASTSFALTRKVNCHINLNSTAAHSEVTHDFESDAAGEEVHLIDFNGVTYSMSIASIDRKPYTDMQIFAKWKGADDKWLARHATAFHANAIEYAEDPISIVCELGPWSR